MLRSHYLLAPISDQGVLVDPSMKDLLQTSMSPPFAYTDVYIYAHGWWTRAEQAMVDYNRFIMGFAAISIGADQAAGVEPRPSLGIGIHWPSMVSEDANTPLTILQPFTYFNRSKMADSVGQRGVYSLIRLMIEARRDAGLEAPRFHLAGHSFGCKVVCAALEELAEDLGPGGLLDDVRFDAALVQAAFDNDAMEPGRSYGRILSTLPRLRVLATRSDLDEAVGKQYALVQRVHDLFRAPTPGLGAAGPSAGTIAAAGGATDLTVGPGYAMPAPASLAGRLTVADLTPLHTANPDGSQPFAGHHTDIFHAEIDRLLTSFFA